MSKLYYAIFPDNTSEKFEEIDFAIKREPKFIIALKEEGIARHVYPNNTVTRERFRVEYLNKSGEKLNLISPKGWKIYDIDDPINVFWNISLKIRDPEGLVKIIGHGQSGADFPGGSGVEYYIRIVNALEQLNSFNNWSELLENNSSTRDIRGLLNEND